MSSERRRTAAAAFGRVLPGLRAAVLSAVSLTVLLAALPGAAPAFAAPPGPASRGSAGQRIADALRHSPVDVDPAYVGAVPPARQRELLARIKRTGLPIKVALVPLVKGDAFDGDPAVLSSVVHDRLGQRDLILITMDEWQDSLAGWEWPAERHQARDAVAAVGFLPQTKNAGLGDRVDKAVDLIARGDGTKVYAQATASLGDSPTPAPGKDHKGGTSGGGSGLAVLLAVLGALVAAVAGAVVWRVRRRRAAGAGSPFAFPQAVFATHEAVDEDALRQRAEAEVIALGESVEDADPQARPGLGRALDAYAAAGKVLDGARGIPDLAGVLALTAEGRDAYDGKAGALPLCFFDPLHGRARRRVGWRPLGSRDTLDVAACAACARAVGEHRAPHVLTDVTREGKRVPYFELAARDSVWAATGYGSLVPVEPDPSQEPDASGELNASGELGASGGGARTGSPAGIAGRVLRGDFGRTRRGR